MFSTERETEGRESVSDARPSPSAVPAPRSRGSRGLLDAAARVLRERGLHAIRVRDIAAAAGMSPSSVMYHYGTVEELLLALHQDVQSRYLALRMEAMRPDQGDAWSRLVSGFKVGLPSYDEQDLIALLYEMHGLTRRHPRHAVLLTQLWEAEISAYEQCIRDGLADGTFVVSDITAAARALLALEDGLALHLISDNRMLNSHTALTMFKDVARCILHSPEDQ